MPIPKPNKDGYYKKTLTVGKNPDGSAKREVIRSKSYREFKELVSEAEHRRKYGYDFAAKDMTVSEWAKRWWETYKKSTVQEDTARAYEIDLRLHILPEIGMLKLDSVQAYHLQNILNKFQGKSTTHTRKVKMTISQLFKRAYIDGFILKDITMGLKLPETWAGERRPLTESEQSAVEHVAQFHRGGLWILTMLYAGLRPEETTLLMWSDVDLMLGQESITVRRAAHWVHGQPVPKNPKKREKDIGKAKERTIPIPPILANALREAKQKWDKKIAAENSAAVVSFYVFTQATKDAPMSQICERRLWASFRRAVDIEMGATTFKGKVLSHPFAAEITAYYLRHTCCTRWFEAEIDIKTVQYLMGHKDIATTLNIYTHVMGKSIEKAANKIRGGQKVDKKQTE